MVGITKHDSHFAYRNIKNINPIVKVSSNTKVFVVCTCKSCPTELSKLKPRSYQRSMNSQDEEDFEDILVVPNSLCTSGTSIVITVEDEEDVEAVIKAIESSRVARRLKLKRQCVPRPIPSTSN